MSKNKNSQKSRSRSKGSKKQYPRTARLNSLLYEIVADYFERVDDEDLGFVTVTGVDVDSDLNKAKVYVSALGSTDPEIISSLSEHRKDVQAQIAKETKIRKTPEVVFMFDPAIEEGQRIEQILRDIN